MKKRLVLSAMVIMVLFITLTFCSCFSFISALAKDSRHASNMKNEATITGGKGISWRSELSYDESKDKDINSSGFWYIGAIPIILQNSRANSQYNGIAVMYCIQNDSYVFELALVESNDQPAGEESSFTVKNLGESGNNTWTVKYILSADGNSFNIIDLGGLKASPLRIGQYLNSDAIKDANARALAGYGSFTVKNKSSDYSITMISISGGQSKKFSQTYQVNLKPASGGLAGVLGGGSFEVGDVVAGKKVIPIGDYVLTLGWSNGKNTTQKVTITSSGSIGYYDQ